VVLLFFERRNDFMPLQRLKADLWELARSAWWDMLYFI
jgi:hypothetical protein